MTELILFAKAPRPGFVKTRLAAELGADTSCAAYRALLASLRINLQSLPSVTVQFTPSGARSELEPLLPPHWRFACQAEGDLGIRLWSAFRQAFQREITRPVIIGSDCPYATAEDIHAAWSALEKSDTVFGPATDGGYWLIGVKKAPLELFTGIDWGTSRVLDQTLSRCRELGLSTALLRTLDDIDTLADWRLFRDYLHASQSLPE